MSKILKRDAIYRSLVENNFSGKVANVVLQKNNVIRIGRQSIKRKKT
jgi:hypothetical protein